MKNSIMRVAIATGAILLIPLIGMLVSTEWNWSLSDFIVMGVLISVTGFLIEFARHKVKSNTKRLALIAGLVCMFLYIWAELAVGILTNWGS